MPFKAILNKGAEMNTPLLIVMIILVMFSAFFSSAETAFSSLNKVKLKAMEQGEKSKKNEH